MKAGRCLCWGVDSGGKYIEAFSEDGVAYSEFTIKQVKEEFGLTIIENKELFGGIEPIRLDDSVIKKLDEYVPLALAVNTEKARSEFIIAYVLLELRAGALWELA